MDQKDISGSSETAACIGSVSRTACIAGGICDAVCCIYALHDRNRSVCTVCAGKDERRSVKASDGVTG